MGISYQVISEYMAYYYADLVPGVFLVRIDTEGPAYEAGLKKGDIITEINGESVVDSFASVLDKYNPGEEIEVQYVREGETNTVKLVLAEAD